MKVINILKTRFLLFYNDDNGIFFGKRTNAMVFWFAIFAFVCIGIKIFQMYQMY